MIIIINFICEGYIHNCEFHIIEIIEMYLEESIDILHSNIYYKYIILYDIHI